MKKIDLTISDCKKPLKSMSKQPQWIITKSPTVELLPPDYGSRPSPFPEDKGYVIVNRPRLRLNVRIEFVGDGGFHSFDVDLISRTIVDSLVTLDCVSL